MKAKEFPQFRVRLDPVMAERLKQEAERNRRSISAQIAFVLDAYRSRLDADETAAQQGGAQTAGNAPQA
jgi:hypothetical protein